MRRNRLLGIDTLRFICALWVVFGHFGLVPWTRLESASGELGRLARAGYHNLAPGPVAVIVFFVISGFCIHYPTRTNTKIDLLPFYSRRHIRILLPVGAMLILAWQMHDLYDAGILWSVVCEEIYYTFYPLILRARARFGWAKLLGVSFLAAFAVVATDPHAGNYPSYGWALNWVLGYPCWLMGCVLAERIDADIRTNPTPSKAGIWVWRASALTLAAACSALRFHTPLTYPWTLDIFAGFACLWLRAEIIQAEAYGPPLLEPLGVFSYSLYLMHWFAQLLWVDSRRWMPSLGEVTDWLIRNVFIVAVAYGFFLVVERPAHRLARRFQRAVLVWSAGRTRSTSGDAPLGD